MEKVSPGEVQEILQQVMHANESGHEVVVKALLAVGAEMEKADRNGRTPLTL